MIPGAVTLACPNCGAWLEITSDVDRFICLHCNTQQIVRRSGGIISIQPLVEGMARVQHGTDKTAAELAIQRLTNELAVAHAQTQQLAIRKNDDILPPTWIEKALPWISSFVFLFGFRSTYVTNPLMGFVIIAVALVLAFGYIWIRTSRINRAIEISEAELYRQRERVEQLEADLDANRRLVSEPRFM